MRLTAEHFAFLNSFPTTVQQPSPPLDLRDPAIIARLKKVFQSSSFQPPRPQRHRPNTATKMTLKDLDTRWLGF